MSAEAERQAQAYEAEVAPRWADPFARLLLAAAPIDPRATVLDVMCGTGSAALPLLGRLEARGRVVALDPSNALLDLARRKAGSFLGKRLFFRHERLERLSFTDDVFDLVVSNAGVLELGEPNRALAECVRVTKPNGSLAMTQCLRGTFQELFDLFREVLERHERDEALGRLDEHIRSFPGDHEAIARFEGLGLRDVSLVRSTFPLEFPTGRAFLGSALVSQRFLGPWTAIAGREEAPRIFGELAATIDTYFGPDPFEMTVQAACVVGRKGEPEAIEEIELRTPAEEGAGAASAPSSGSGSWAAPPASAAAEEDDASPDRVTPVRAFPIPPEASGVRAPPEAPPEPPAAPGALPEAPAEGVPAGPRPASAAVDSAAPATTPAPEPAPAAASSPGAPPPPADPTGTPAAPAPSARKGPPPLPPEAAHPASEPPPASTPAPAAPDIFGAADDSSLRPVPRGKRGKREDKK